MPWIFSLNQPMSLLLINRTSYMMHSYWEEYQNFLARPRRSYLCHARKARDILLFRTSVLEIARSPKRTAAPLLRLMTSTLP
eukprot:6676307-Pyramimonas_sp.AAC.1